MEAEAIQGIMQLTAAATPMVMGALAKKDAKARETDAAKEANKIGEQLKALEENRQAVVNPYQNLSVATQAAEMEAQEADASLANTLDTMRAGGFGGAGATALARQAAKAKQGVSADIQKQEQANQTKFAEGEQKRFAAQEERDNAKLDRLASLQEGYQQREMDAAAGKQAINQQTASAVGGVVNSIAGNPEALQSLFGGGNSGGGGVPSIDEFTSATGVTTSQANSIANAANMFGSLPSDRRLKKNIKLVDESISGLKIYTFEYINKKGLYKGVMSDEVPSNAVVVGEDGFDMVDYSKIDVKFEKLNNGI